MSGDDEKKHSFTKNIASKNLLVDFQSLNYATDLKKVAARVNSISDVENAKIRLQLMTHRGLTTSLLSFVIVGLVTIYFTLMLLTYLILEARNDATDDDFTALIYGLDLAIRSLALLLSFIAFVYFSWSLLYLKRFQKGFIHKEQYLILFLLALLLVGPGSGFYQIINSSRDIDNWIDLVSPDTNYNDDEEFNLINPSELSYSKPIKVISNFISVFTITSYFILTILLKKSFSEQTPPISSNFSIFSYFKSLDKITIFIIFYFITFGILKLTLSLIFDYMPNFIPLMGIIPIFKICLKRNFDSVNYLSINETEFKILQETNICQNKDILPKLMLDD